MANFHLLIYSKSREINLQMNTMRYLYRFISVEQTRARC